MRGTTLSDQNQWFDLDDGANQIPKIPACKILRLITVKKWNNYPAVKQDAMN